MRGEQRLDLPAQFEIVAALFVENPRARVAVALDGRGEHILHALPAIGRGRDVAIGRPVAHRCSSRFNHARAIAQSRLTVAGDTFNASAVSSTLIPP